MTRPLSLLAAIALLCGIAAAADLSGAWTGQMPTRNGETRDVTFKLKQDAGALTGTMSAFDNDVPIKEGKVEGDNLSFNVTLEFNGNSFKILFTGVAKGDRIEFTREREGSGNKQTFAVKRVS